MRILLVGILFVALGLITTIFVLPGLVDADAVRTQIEKLASEKAGGAVSIQGSLRISFLPTPKVSIGEARLLPIKQPGGAILQGSVDRADLKLAFWPLLTGEVKIEQITLVRPLLDYSGNFRELVHLFQITGSATTRPLAIQRADIVDGRIAASLRGQKVGIENIVGFAQIGPDQSQSDLQGQLGSRQLRLQSEIGQGNSAGKAPIRLQVSASDASTSDKMLFTGLVALASATIETSGKISIESANPDASLDYLQSLGFSLDQIPDLGEAALRFEAELDASNQFYALDAIDLQLGEARIEGTLEYDHQGEGQIFDARLSLSGWTIPESMFTDGGGAIAIQKLARAFTGAFYIEAREITYRDDTLRNLHLEARAEQPGEFNAASFSANLPGAGQIEFDGTADLKGETPALKGKLSLASSELPLLLQWLPLQQLLGVEELDLSAWQQNNIDLQGEFEWSSERIAIRGAELRLDAMQGAGSLLYIAEGRGTLAAQATLNRLDLNQIDLDTWQMREGNIQIWLRALPEMDIATDIRLQRVSLAGHRAQSLRLKAEKHGSNIRIENFDINDLAGATFNMEGELDAASGQLDVTYRLQSAAPSRLLRAFDVEPPSILALLGAIVSQGQISGSLAQADLQTTLTSDAFTIEVEGTIADFGGRNELSLLAAASSDSADDYLRLFGLSQLVDQGGADLQLAFSRRAEADNNLQIKAKLGANHLNADLNFDPSVPLRPAISGSINLNKLDAVQLGKLHRWASARYGAGDGPIGDWPGRWPAGEISWHWLSWADFDLSFQIEESNAHLTLKAETPDQLHSSFSLPYAGGRLDGSLDVTAVATRAILNVEFQLQNASSQLVLEELGADGFLEGKLDGSFSLNGPGRSLSDFIARVEGSGKIQLRAVTMNGLDIDTAGKLSLGTDNAGPFQTLGGDVSIDRGIMRTSRAFDLTGPRGKVEIDAELDLWAWMMTAQLRGPNSELKLFGPPSALQPTGDAAIQR